MVVLCPNIDAQQASTWELDGPACMLARLVRHVSSSGRTRILVASLSEDVATLAELATLYHGRWRIEEAFKRLKHRLGLESVSGLSQQGYSLRKRKIKHAKPIAGAVAA